MDAEKKALLSLTLVPRIGSRNIKNLISYAGSANAANHLPLSKLLKIPVMCIHTAIDNIVQGFFEEIFKKASFSTLGDIFKKIPINNIAIRKMESNIKPAAIKRIFSFLCCSTIVLAF